MTLIRIAIAAFSDHYQLETKVSLFLLFHRPLQVFYSMLFCAHVEHSIRGTIRRLQARAMQPSYRPI